MSGLAYKIYDKKNLCVYGDKDTFQTEIVALYGSYRKKLKDGTSGWLVPIRNESLLKALIMTYEKRLAKSVVVSKPIVSDLVSVSEPVVTKVEPPPKEILKSPLNYDPIDDIQTHIKHKNSQTKYHRASSEKADEESEEGEFAIESPEPQPRPTLLQDMSLEQIFHSKTPDELIKHYKKYTKPIDTPQHSDDAHIDEKDSRILLQMKKLEHKLKKLKREMKK